MTITIITNTSDNIRELSNITLPNKRRYADRNGYDVFCYEFDYQRYNELVLDALRVTSNRMRENDIVMTMGSDTMFMNWNIRIEDVLQPDDQIVIARERTTWWSINDDVVIWRCTKEVIDFYERLINDYEIWCHYPWRLQAHIWNLMQEEPEVRKLIRLVEPEVMNQHPSKWQLGNWVVHFYSMSIPDKVAHAKMFQENWGDGSATWKQKVDSVRPGVI